MRRYIKEIIIFMLQMFMFYIFPLFSGPTDAMGMVVLILSSTIILSMIFASVSFSKIKYVYPLIIAIIFVPSVFIYYNESALVHSLWYLITGYIGCILGIVIYKLIHIKIIK